jgi:hypothetical protein
MEAWLKPECLLCKHKALSSNPSPEEEKEEELSPWYSGLFI